MTLAAVVLCCAHMNIKYRHKHKDAIMLTLEDGTRIFEHRFVMEQHLGRPLGSHECVVHNDGCRSHNKLVNLKLISRSQTVPRSRRVTLTCPCGTDFQRSAAVVKTKRAQGQKVFCCSRKCAQQYAAVGRKRKGS